MDCQDQSAHRTVQQGGSRGVQDAAVSGSFRTCVQAVAREREE